MKYIKHFEDKFIPKTGDIVYCINNKGVEQELDLGGRYTVGQVWPERDQFRLVEPGSRWMSFRFTQDPYHPIIVKLTAKKYNL